MTMHFHIHQKRYYHFLKTTMSLKWPAKSSDLNITEQVWGYLSEKVYKGPKILNAAQLREKIDHILSKFKNEISSLIKNAYSTYFERVLKVITRATRNIRMRIDRNKSTNKIIDSQ